MKRLRPVEILLIQILFYLILWFIDDYVAALITAILSSVALFIFLISLVVEWIERSKVPRWYFILMFFSFLAPIISGIIYFLVNGEISWFNL